MLEGEPVGGDGTTGLQQQASGPPAAPFICRNNFGETFLFFTHSSDLSCVAGSALVLPV